MKLRIATPILGIFGAISSLSVMGSGEESPATKLQQKTEISNKPYKEDERVVSTKNKQQELFPNSSLERPVQESIKEITVPPIQPSSKVEPSIAPPKITAPIQKPVSPVPVANPSAEDKLKALGFGEPQRGNWKLPTSSTRSSGEIADCIEMYLIEGGEWDSNMDLKSFKVQTSFKTVESLFQSKKINSKWSGEKDSLKKACGKNKPYLYVGINKHGILRWENSADKATLESE